jgi:plastocyanin|tara:strand:+ start:120 stop:575 length:456 start_codon:yes stop_codon:yes gene_type:complete
MQFKKEVDIVLMIVFVGLFLSFGIYMGVKDQNGEKIIKTTSTLNRAPGAGELPRKVIEEMPAIIEEEFKIIEIKNTKFYPSELNISKGTIVYWVNKDNGRNYQVYEKAANKKFHSGQIQPDESFNYTFEEEGEYRFGDAIFTYMSGVVRVE